MNEKFWVKLTADLRGLHGVMFGKLNLKLVGFISVEGPWSSIYFNNPPLQITFSIIT